MIRLLPTLLLCGCASIVSSRNYPVTLETFPPGKEVVVKDDAGKILYKGGTPMTVTLPASDGFFSGAEYSVAIVKEGKTVAQTQLSASVDPWYVGNILFGGLIGLLLIDPATGAMWKLDDHIMVGPQERKKVSERAEVWYDDPVSF